MPAAMLNKLTTEKCTVVTNKSHFRCFTHILYIILQCCTHIFYCAHCVSCLEQS